MEDDYITFDARPKDCRIRYLASPYTPYPYSWVATITGATVTLHKSLVSLKHRLRLINGGVACA